MGINIELLKSKLYPVANALYMISETLVDESKQHMTAQAALDIIRSYLHETDVICSRYKVDQMIDECTGEKPITNVLEEKPSLNFLNFNIDTPSVCDKCPNNIKNGGSGICHCTLPYFSRTVLY